MPLDGGGGECEDEVLAHSVRRYSKKSRYLYLDLNVTLFLQSSSNHRVSLQPRQAFEALRTAASFTCPPIFRQPLLLFLSLECEQLDKRLQV